MTTTFIGILEKERLKELKPFLQSLDTQQKKELAIHLKKLSKEWLENKTVQTKKVGNSITTRFERKATETQREIILIAAFCCMSRADFEKVELSGHILEEALLRKVIDWYRPDWFDGFVNRQANNDFVPWGLNYAWIMELTEQQWLQPSKELIVMLLPAFLFEQKNRTSFYRPERLLERKVTLDEHLWWMFDMESTIHSAGRWLYFDKDLPAGERNWIHPLQQLSAAGQIDRQRLLRESLLASNRNFNKNLSGWYVDLFLALEANDEELFSLQDAMMGVLGAPHSKPVNTVLNCLKRIVDRTDFFVDAFLGQAPVLLASNIKTVITGTLALLEKLAKRNAALRADICALTVQVFISPDEQLQLRAAKLIHQYRAGLGKGFSELLQPYGASLLSPARVLLGDLIIVNKEANSATEEATLVAAEEYLPIDVPDTLDDIVFLASQAFDHNRSWHIDILPAVLIDSAGLLTGKEISKLQPALQRALNTFTKGIQMNQGLLDVFLAYFFIDTCLFLVRTNFTDAGDLLQLFQQYEEKSDGKTQRWTAIDEKDSYLAGRLAVVKEPFFIPHGQLLLTALDKIRNMDRLPLLSTPTHEPAFIEPSVLVRRLALYQRSGSTPADMDFQIAVSRLLPGRNEAAVMQARAELSGEFLQLMLFLLDVDPEPAGPFSYKDVWLCAVLAKREKRADPFLGTMGPFSRSFAFYTGAYGWKSGDHEVVYKRYDHQEMKNVEAKMLVTEMWINFPAETAVKEVGQAKGWARLVGKFLQKKPAADTGASSTLLYDLLQIKEKYFELQYANIRRVLLLSPHNTAPFLAQVMHRCLKYPTFTGVDDKKMVTAAIQTLYEIWEGGNEMVYLFLGTCMLSEDKTISGIAAEIWLKGTAQGIMDQDKLGNVIGVHERIEFAPLKRFTDLAGQKLFLVNAFYNKHLQLLIGRILRELPETPIKGQKKLLEMYAELGKRG